MLKLNSLQQFRRIVNQYYIPAWNIRAFTEKKDKKDDPQQDGKAKESQNKLNELLKSMLEMKPDSSVKKSIELAKPKSKRVAKGKRVEKPKTFDENVTSAAKEVAEKLGGDVKQTESELLAKLLKPAADEQKPSESLSDIVRNMKIDRESKAPEEISRAKQIQHLIAISKQEQEQKSPKRKSVAKSKFQRKTIVSEKVELFGSEGFGIFTKEKLESSTEGPVNKTWQQLQNRELRLSVTHPPSNYFQQMILWTQQGKIWKFPIDNEQGLEKEQSVYFTEHIFLEKHLEPWCPTKGPIRHFMELVCVGLSKNPYMTVEEKKDHIVWYKNYFEEKKTLLQEVGAFPEVEPNQKRLE